MMGAIVAGTAVNSGTAAFGGTTAAGSTLTALVASNSSAFSITTSSTGWSMRTQGGVSFGWISLWEKVNCAAGESAPVFTHGGSDLWTRLFELQGAATTSPADQQNASSSA